MIMFMVIGGLVLAYIAKSLLAHEEKKPEAAMRNVPMPISDLPPGTVVTEDHIGQGPMAIADLKRDMLLANKVIVGRVVKELLKAAQPIRAGQLYEPGTYPPLKVGKGMQAFTIDARGATAIVDGLIKPGEYVDLHFTVTALQGDPRLRGGMTMTLLKGVKVLAINRMVIQGRVDSGSNSVTLELTPEQVNIISVAQDKGVLTLSSNPTGKGDGGIALAAKDRATLEEILGLDPVKQPDPPPQPFVLQMFRGGNRQELEFRANNRIVNRMPFAPPTFTPGPTPSGTQTDAPNSSTPNPAAPNSGAPNTGAPNSGSPTPATAAPPAANGPPASGRPTTPPNGANVQPGNGSPSV